VLTPALGPELACSKKKAATDGQALRVCSPDGRSPPAPERQRLCGPVVQLMPMRYFLRAGFLEGRHGSGPPDRGRQTGLLRVVLFVSVEVLLSGILGHLHKLFFGASAHCSDGIERSGH
jgi:hypothetical protein